MELEVQILSCSSKTQVDCRGNFNGYRKMTSRHQELSIAPVEFQASTKKHPRCAKMQAKDSPSYTNTDLDTVHREGHGHIAESLLT